MPARSVQEASISTLVVQSDGTAAGTTATMLVRSTDGSPATVAEVDTASALSVAALAIGGGTTAAQVREAVRQFFVAARAQGRAAGGWS